MKSFYRFAALTIVAATAMAQTPPPTVRVGTFHKPSVVTAFYRSPQWAGQLKRKMAEREAAKIANDTKKVQELEAWGARNQELAHQQLAGAANIANILDSLAGAMPEIARKAQVAVITNDLLYADPSIKTVDVTGQILDWLQADEATRNIVRQLENRPARVH
jgi:hypothetical protein